MGQHYTAIMFAVCAALITSSCVTGSFFSSGVRTVLFDCEGRRMIVSFNDTDRTASVSLPGEPLYVLNESAAGNGYYYYSDGRHGLRGRSYEARWEVGRATPTVCRQAS